MRIPVLFACAALLLAAPPSAFAQAPQSDAQVAARKRGEDGLAHFKDGRWDDAYAAFAEADRLFHAPTLVLYMARCRRSQGRLLEAKALFEKVLAEPVPPNAPEAFKKAVAAAHAEGDALRAKIPTVRVAVTGPGADHAKVRIDGAIVGADELANGKALDPGPHTIAADAEGASGSSQITLAEGESRRVDLALRGQAAEPAGAAPRGSLVPAGVALGVGGAAVVAGVVTGVLALGKIGDAHAGCQQASDGVWHCPPASKAANGAAADGAHALGPASGALLAIGGAAVAAGVVLAIVRPGGGKPQDKVGIAIDAGPGWLGVRGRF